VVECADDRESGHPSPHFLCPPWVDEGTFSARERRRHALGAQSGQELPVVHVAKLPDSGHRREARHERWREYEAVSSVFVPAAQSRHCGAPHQNPYPNCARKGGRTHE